MLLNRIPVENTKQLTLSWKGLVSVFVGTLLMGLLFVHFGRFDLARPTFFSVVVIVFATAMKWELRRHVWFWAVMVAAAALHIVLILFVPWTTRWVPALVMLPIAAADVGAILSIIKLLESQFGTVNPSGSGASSLN
jgi:hypothetical protein